MRGTLPATLLLLLAGARFGWGQEPRPTSAPSPASAGLPRYEAGLQIADIRTGCIGSRDCYLPSFGLGIGGTLNLNPHFALDANYLTTPASSSVWTNVDGGRASELLIGTRVEARARHYGFFVKAQPGYFDWSHVITQVTYTSSSYQFTYGHSTRFVSDLGAGVEYSPTSRVHVRVEFADLVMRYAGSWENNFQPSAAVYYGLGRSLAWKPPVYDPKKAHPFLSPVNLTLLTGSLLASTADSITTQRALSHGHVEGDPLARPLTKYGWSGQISLMVLELSGETTGMYGLHRLGLHWLERLTPVAIATAHGVLAYNNVRVSSAPAN